ncbi:MAG: hypothetical protein GF310_08750 [candidate division Zixibacteria bacterium]|nr:hypothetical protein [candidate division Zixibacteria bacterium]
MEAVQNKVETQADFAEYGFFSLSSNKKASYKKAALSLEIGPSHIIWSVFRGAFGSMQITDSGLVSEENIVKPSRLYPHLDRIIKKHDLQKASISICLTLPDGLLRCYKIPVVPKNELEQVVKWEGRKVFPFNLDNAIFEWKIIGVNEWGGSKKYEIQAAAISRKSFMPIFNYFQERKLQVNWMTFTSLAWESLIKTKSRRKEKTGTGNFALVRMIGSDLMVLFFQNNNLEFLRENSLEAGNMGGGFEESLLYLDITESKRISAIINDDSIDYKAVAQTISDSLDYYHGQFAQRTIDRIYLSFPEPLLPAATENVGRMVDLECVPISFEKGTDALPQEAPRNLVYPSGFLSHKKNSDLNLIPGEFQSEIKERKRFKYAIYTIAFLVIALFALSLFQANQNSMIEASRISMESDLQSILDSKAYEGINILNEKASIFQTQLSSLRGNSHPEADILRALSHLTPPEIRLTNLNIFRDIGASRGVFLSGFASSHEYPEVVVADFIKDLKAIPGLKKIDLKNQNTKLYTGGKRVEFTIEMELR